MDSVIDSDSCEREGGKHHDNDEDEEQNRVLLSISHVLLDRSTNERAG